MNSVTTCSTVPCRHGKLLRYRESAFIRILSQSRRQQVMEPASTGHENSSEVHPGLYSFRSHEVLAFQQLNLCEVRKHFWDKTGLRITDEISFLCARRLPTLLRSESTYSTELQPPTTRINKTSPVTSHSNSCRRGVSHPTLHTCLIPSAISTPRSNSCN